MVEAWVKELVRKTMGESNMAVGQILTHPDGRTVKIINGQFWGEHGVSNFWYWRAVLSDGSLAPELEHGYGWQ